MNQATRTLVELSLKSRSVADTVALFKASFAADLTHNQIDSVRRSMAQAAKPRRNPVPPCVADVPIGGTDCDTREAARAGSEALHCATVRMAIRNGITLPGLSAAHTRAIARNLDIIR